MKWTIKAIQKEAKKYKFRSVFADKSCGAYHKAIKYNILNKVCLHMTRPHKWTKEKVIKEALKYNARSEFATKSIGAYNEARKLKILNEVCFNMKRPHSHKWTPEAIKKEARKYKSRNEFQRKSGGAHFRARQLKILDKVCPHMKNPLLKWTPKTIKKEALKYKTRSKFKLNRKHAYDTARKLGILDEVCTHMLILHNNPLDNWTRETIKKEALKYKSRGEFRKKSLGAYQAMHRQKISNKICSHMIPPKTVLKWTPKTIKKEAKKYKSRSEFEKKAKGAYDKAWSLKTLDKVCSHMKPLHQKWTKKTIKKEAKKYQTRLEFQRKSDSAYHKARRLKIIDKVCLHMTNGRIKWTEEAIEKEALKYDSRNEFRKKSAGAYYSAYKRGILDKFCFHMKCLCHKWTEDEIKKEALKYNLRGEFAKKSKNAYQNAHRLGILNKICSHMKSLRHKNWTQADVKKEALKYKTRSEFAKKSKNAYQNAHRLGMLNKVCLHMPNPHNKWTPKTIKKEAQKYKTRADFAEGASGAYFRAGQLGILNTVCSHMRKPHYKNLKFKTMKKTTKKAARNSCKVTKNNCLAIKFPHLLREWDYKTNLKRNYVPNKMSARNRRDIVSWICPICGNKWDTTARERMEGCGCINCFRKNNKKNKDYVIKVLNGDSCNSKEREQKIRDFYYQTKGKKTICIECHTPFYNYSGRTSGKCDHCMEAEEKQMSLFLNYPNIYRMIDKKKTATLKTRIKKQTLNLTKISYKSDRKAYFKCTECGHSWKEIIREVVDRKYKCPNCKYTCMDEINKNQDSNHYIKKAKPTYFVRWTRENAIKEAKKYKTRSDLALKKPCAYRFAWKNGILDEVCAHMPNPRNKWTVEAVKKEAKKYRTKTEFATQNASAYNKAIKYGILNTICTHMPNLRNNKLKKEKSINFSKNNNNYFKNAKTNFLGTIYSGIKRIIKKII